MNGLFVGVKTPEKNPGKRIRGQVSTEFLMGAMVILLLFLVVLLFIEQTKQSSEAAQQNASELEVCTKVSSIITYMSSNPPYSETQFEIMEDVNVVNNYILVGDYFCPFLGKASNVQLYMGLVRAFDINGTVVFTNDLNYSPFNPSTSPPDTGSDQSSEVILLIDDKSQVWVNEVEADDVSYAVSADDADEDPDWVEFRFSNAGLTSTNQVTDVRVLIKHFESYHVGLGGVKSMVQCCDGPTCMNVEEYAPSFTELYYQSPNLSWCISDWNKANNARIRMTYEPNGVSQTISLDYGRLDVNFTQVGTVIDLWEHQNDLPQPVDFRTDVNSTANTFGPSAGNDGWDWNPLQYGGILSDAVSFNADPNNDGSIADSAVGTVDRLELKLGGGVPGATSNPDDSAIVGPVTSGAYGIQFDINAEVYALILSGADANLSFIYSVDADGGWGNALDAGEEAWVKARFGQSGSMTYLGSDIDGLDNDADASSEMWWSDHPTDATSFFTLDVSPLITGAGSYYLEIGGALSDWETSNEGLGIYIDNINLVIA